MNIPFTHKNCHYNFNTVTGLIRSWTKTVPLMNASEDLRNAAVRAKVDLLRMRSRTQHNPLDLQGITNDQTQSQECNHVQKCKGTCGDFTASVELEQPQYPAD